MAETTADVRRDIELTRERMSDTLAQLERKVNVMQIIRDHPWPALALAVGAGFALAGSRADVKAAAATMAATGGASTRVGSLLDEVAARVIRTASDAVGHRVDGWMDELKAAIGAPDGRRGESHLAGTPSQFSGQDQFSGPGPRGARTSGESRATSWPG